LARGCEKCHAPGASYGRIIPVAFVSGGVAMTPKYFVGALSALILAASLWSYPANALTFHYSFATIEGFISGLADNTNGQAALSVTVTASSIGGLGEYAPGSVNSFDVSGGAILFTSQFQSTVGNFHLLLGHIGGTTIAHGILDNVGVHGLGGDITYSATPLPAALPLFATGLGALGLLGWRRKRKKAA
jgi:hypothetical protein